MKKTILITIISGASIGITVWYLFAPQNTQVISIAHSPVKEAINIPSNPISQIETLSEGSVITDVAVTELVLSLPETLILHDVPFTSQAPFAQWSNPLFQDGCEEASLLMAARYFRSGSVPITPTDATDAIATLSDFARENYGFYLDISATDTARLGIDFYDHIDTMLINNISTDDILHALYDGALVILPANGRALKNPNFTDGGPENHMLVVIGYDPITEEFITNDPGTKNGRHYRYDKEILLNAIRDYPSGHSTTYDKKATSQELRRGIIVSEK